MKKFIIMLLFIILAFSIVFSEEKLTVNDHTMIMKFILEHPVEVKHWLKRRGRSGKIVPEEVLNFISKTAITRSNSRISMVAKRAASIANSRTRVALRKESSELIKRIRSAKNIEEIESILKEAASTRGASVSGSEVALLIIKDGIKNGIYSPSSYSAYMPRKKGRGIFGAIADELLDTAKDDAVGAIVGAVVGPEGAVAGAIAASSSSVAEMVLNLVLGSPEPAY